MGTSQSKTSPDGEMRRKMENGFDDEDDEDMNALGINDRVTVFPERTRSKSNLSFQKADRFHKNEEDEYFNKIYNNRNDKPQNTLTGSSPSVVKSAPVGPKKDKDPEVAAAIAELEETFKVLGDAPITKPEQREEANLETLESGSDDLLPTAPIQEISTSSTLSVNSSSSSPNFSVEDHSSRSECSGGEPNIFILEEPGEEHTPYDRHLISRAGVGTGSGLTDQQDLLRMGSKHLDLNVDSGSSSSSASFINPKSRGGRDLRNLLVSSHSTMKHTRPHTQSNQQSILMLQRKDFQNQRRLHIPSTTTDSESRKQLGPNNTKVEPEEDYRDWSYEPPKIEGFDIDKFKEINSKVTPSGTIVPMIMRVGEEDPGYYSRSPDIPAYTKDELELIASLEREVY